MPANPDTGAMVSGKLLLPSGETITCSVGYIDESGGLLPRLAKMLAREQRGRKCTRS